MKQNTQNKKEKQTQFNFMDEEQIDLALFTDIMAPLAVVYDETIESQVDNHELDESEDK